MIVKGSPGASCQSVSKFLTDNLGTVESEVLTEEYYTSTQAQEVNTSAQRVRVVRNQGGSYDIQKFNHYIFST